MDSSLRRFSFEGYMIDSCASSAIFPSSWALETLADIQDDGDNDDDRRSRSHSGPDGRDAAPPVPRSATDISRSDSSSSFERLFLTLQQPRSDDDGAADSSASEYSADDELNSSIMHSPATYPESVNCENSSTAETTISPASIPPLSPASFTTTFLSSYSSPQSPSASEETHHLHTPTLSEPEEPVPAHTGCPVCMTFGPGACTRARPNAGPEELSCADEASMLLGSDAWMPLSLHRTPSNRFAWGAAKRSSIIVIAPPSDPRRSREASVLSLPSSPRSFASAPLPSSSSTLLPSSPTPTQPKELEPPTMFAPSTPMVTLTPTPEEEDTTGYFAEFAFLEECAQVATPSPKKRKGKNNRVSTFRRVRRILSV